MASQAELTPCGAMFDIFKRAAHLSHIELCGLVLSSRPLADGRSPQSRAADRSWVSRFIVRAPVGTLQERFLPITAPRPRALCRSWPCVVAIPWTPRP